jgi:hypothetical protein
VSASTVGRPQIASAVEPCGPRNVVVEIGPPQGAGGAYWYGISLRNHAATPCGLDPHFVTFAGMAGSQNLPFGPTPMDQGGHISEAPPGRVIVATAGVSTKGFCDDPHPFEADRVVVRLPGGDISLALPEPVEVSCGGATGYFAESDRVAPALGSVPAGGAGSPELRSRCCSPARWPWAATVLGGAATVGLVSGGLFLWRRGRRHPTDQRD